MGQPEMSQGARRKRRPSQHIMEEQSKHLVRAALPSHWVIHDFDKPDYGIDLVIEVFEKVDNTFETLGEYVYVQVKSVSTTRIEKLKVYPVPNVARQPWTEDKSRWIECDVVKFSIETDLLFTVQSLGTSVSALLFVVDLSKNTTYFLCLNDYIEKYLQPSHPRFFEQETVTLYIPAYNVLGKAEGERALTFYGKRGKFLSSFSKFQFQRTELDYLFAQPCWSFDSNADFDANDAVAFAGGISVVRYFLQQISYLDIWDFSAWALMGLMKSQIVELEKVLSGDVQLLSQDIFQTKRAISNLWWALANTNNVFEEIVREFHLPKYVSLLSLPQAPPEQFA
jgi:Domain of unknown function (DUF4365)